MSVEIGIERIDEFTVEDRLLTDVGGTLGSAVLSTPGMIGMMERTAAILSLEQLPEGRSPSASRSASSTSAHPRRARLQGRATLTRSSTTASSASRSR